LCNVNERLFPSSVVTSIFAFPYHTSFTYSYSNVLIVILSILLGFRTQPSLGLWACSL
jgi:hypothetical protein